MIYLKNCEADISWVESEHPVYIAPENIFSNASSPVAMLKRVDPLRLIHPFFSVYFAPLWQEFWV